MHSFIYAEEFDSPLTELIEPPIDDTQLIEKNLPSRSNIMEIINQQTPVKSQGRRGTCTMFTSIGVLEHIFIREGYYKPSEID